jgi:hypothetical protein
VHYYQNNTDREKQLTRDFVSVHQAELCRALDLHQGDKVVVEMQKSRFARAGDVDIALWKNPYAENETFIAVEVKCLFLDSQGNFKSEKALKHNKQIRLLEDEGWDYVYFFDFIVTEPAIGWFHPQAFAGHDKYAKKVESAACGHLVFQINSVAHKPESMAGSISCKTLQLSQRLATTEKRERIKSAFISIDFGAGALYVDAG